MDVYALIAAQNLHELEKVLADEPQLALETIFMSNGLQSYVLHQLIPMKIKDEISKEIRVNVIDFIIKTIPLAVRLQNSQGMLPIHLLLQNGPPPIDSFNKFILTQRLIKEYP